MIHDIKCWPEYFQAVKSGIKPFELRKDDRGYAVGDILHLREFDPDTATYTGDDIDKAVTYVLPTKLFGALGEGAKYAIMGLSPHPDWTPCADGLPTNPNVACSLTVYNDDIFGEPQIVLLPWYAAYNSEIKQWVTADGVEVEEEVLAWMPCPEHYRADDTTGKVKED